MTMDTRKEKSEKQLGKKGKIIAALCIVLLLVFAAAAVKIIQLLGQTEEITSPDEMKVYFIDVGQADSMLIQSGKYNMLIDAGKNEDGWFVVNFLKQKGVKKLDYVICTHPHEDHIGGMDMVIKSFRINHLFMPKVSHSTRSFQDVVDAIYKKNLKVTRPVAGSTYKLGKGAFTIIAPNRDYGENLNNWSIGIKLTFGNNNFILCGDAEEEAELDICSNGIDMNADVLKLNHHGSFTGTTTEMLDAVTPEAVVISCAAMNIYNHPNKKIMKRIKKRGIEVYRTDIQGTITAVSDGEEIVWETERQADGVYY